MHILALCPIRCDPSLLYSFSTFLTDSDPYHTQPCHSFHQRVNSQWSLTVFFTPYKNFWSHLHFLSMTCSTCSSGVFHFLAHLVCRDRMTKDAGPQRNTFPYHTGSLSSASHGFIALSSLTPSFCMAWWLLLPVGCCIWRSRSQDFGSLDALHWLVNFFNSIRMDSDTSLWDAMSTLVSIFSF